MSEIGSGAGSSYPASLDTDATLESTSTKVRKEWANDVTSAIVAIETELGTDPSGTAASVAARLGAEHNADGTHPALTPTLKSYTKATLPAAGTAGRLARVTDDIRGIWKDTGTEWVSVTGYADVTADFGGSISDAAATGYPLKLRAGKVYTVSTPTYVSADIIGSGEGTAETEILLTGTGTLLTGDSHITWRGFKLRSDTASQTFIKVETDYVTLEKITFIGNAAVTGQIGVEYNTTPGGGRSHNTLRAVSFVNVDYPVKVTGSGYFNNNHIGGLGDYWSGFVDAITLNSNNGASVNVFGGYFEGGTSLITINGSLFRWNHLYVWPDNVINVVNTNMVTTETNFWYMLYSLFTTTGSGSLSNQAFFGDRTFAPLVLAKRFLMTGATALVPGDIALSAGWGNTASVSAISGTDQRFRFTVTSAGTGQAANPTATLTFKDGTWTTAPFAVCSRAGGSQRTVPFEVTAITATTLQLTFLGTPVAGETYTVECIVMG